jgi:SAM-dependent methyltransferase
MDSAPSSPEPRSRSVSNRNRVTSRLDRLVRDRIPSVAVATYSRAWTPLAALDWLAARPFREFRRLPPSAMRARVGVGNRIVFNHPYFLEYGARTVVELAWEGVLQRSTRLLDLGCGCGRLASALRRYGFEGAYVGVDVDREMVAWCRANLASEDFAFEHVDRFSEVYNPSGSRSLKPIPADDRSQDLVVAQSLFTHVLEPELRWYLREAARVLAPGGALYVGVFCIEDLRDHGLLESRWNLVHRMGGAHCESIEYPEAAVGYERELLLGACADAGLEAAEVRSQPGQSILAARRATAA